MDGLLSYRRGQPNGLIDAVDLFFGALVELGFEAVLEFLVGGFFELK